MDIIIRCNHNIQHNKSLLYCFALVRITEEVCFVSVDVFIHLLNS